MKETVYSTKIELKGEQMYDEISSFLSAIACGAGFDKPSVLYFMDKSDEKVIRLNQKKNTVELTDKVDKWIIDSINHIKHQEEVR